MCIGFEYETASFEMLCCDIDPCACVQPIKYTLLLSQTDKRRDVSYTLAVYSTALPFMCVPCPPIPSNQVRDNHNPSLWTLSDLGDCAVKSAWVVDRKQCRWTHRQQQVLHQSTVQVAIVVPMSDIFVYGCFFLTSGAIKTDDQWREGLRFPYSGDVQQRCKCQLAPKYL
jgi:hypothetical protein